MGMHSDNIPTNGSSSYYDSPKPRVEKQKVGRPYQINGKWYTPKIDPNYDEIGIASWYGPGFHGKSTANGERFDENKISAAHTTLPLPSYVEVTNLGNGRKLYVRVNDRGPFADNRIIDLSKRAAELLGSKATGLARVRVRIVEPPKNTTVIAPTGSVQVGKGYRPQPPKVQTNKEILLAENDPLSLPQYKQLTSENRTQPMQLASATAAPHAVYPNASHNPAITSQRASQRSNQAEISQNAEPLDPFAQEITYNNGQSNNSVNNATNHTATYTGSISAYPSNTAYPTANSRPSAPVQHQKSPYAEIHDTELYSPSEANGYLPSGSYAIKVGVFSSPHNIKLLKKNLASLGTIKISQIAHKGKILSEVSLEGFKNSRQIQETIDVLNQYGINDTVVLDTSYN